jgi:hypothetical protein
MKNKFLTLVLLFGVLPSAIGCTDEDSTRRILTSQGYTDIKIEGYSFTGCSKDDGVRTEFTARSPIGTYVQGVVCCGLLFKNCTVRW